jgi:hypothetical protein
LANKYANPGIPILSGFISIFKALTIYGANDDGRMIQSSH